MSDPTKSATSCNSLCGSGSTELALPLRILGLCLRLRLILSGHCPKRH